MEIKDSGERREFTTGAVRDIADGKGRCDLLPLDTVAKLLGDQGMDYRPLIAISHYIYTGEKKCLYTAIRLLCHDTGVDLVTALLEVSKHYEDGAKKYSARNWEKGIDLHCYIDSGVRHYLKFIRGDNDEPHMRAFVWNMLGALWTHEHKPELIDLPFAENNKENEE